ncbi:MAG TPA: hypothetical protein VG963_05265 [Polyangiaceae bacterium]|nr:hypothetical protein [Polyangiaceae bacterium]
MRYSRDIKPLFDRHCVSCHNSAAQGGRPDLEDPITQDADSPGMFLAPNDWYDEKTKQVPPRIVVPYDPDQSFLLEKISNRNLLPENYDDAKCVALAQDASTPLPPECRSYYAGSFMPLQQSVPLDQIAAIRQWIMDGANGDDSFQSSVAPLFGDPTQYLAGPCGFCHYPGGPQTPDFTQPFDPVVGVVNVSAHFRADLELVTPGDPDHSFLMTKLETTLPTTSDIPPGDPRLQVGAPMPRNYEPLSDDEVDLVRRWIAAGAKTD